MKIVLDPAYILHTKPYRETSLLVDFFTLNHGKISVIARSARGPKSRFKGVLQPFVPLLISCQGKTELLQLSQVEQSGPSFFLQGKTLFNGLYLNELLLRLLHRFDSCPAFFSVYQNTLSDLATLPHESAAILRRFEIKLLSELGYGLQLHKESNGAPVQQNYLYHFNPEQGFTLSTNNTTHPPVFQGEHLLAIAKNNFESTDVLKTARRLMRIAIKALLGDYQIKTRELFG